MEIFLKYAIMGFRSQTIYKTSFVLLCIGQFFVPFFVYLGLVILFNRFDSLAGWSFSEVAILYGSIHTAFSLSEGLARGFDAFSTLIVKGDFDRLLLRPLPIALQVLGSKFEFTRLGRLIQGIVVLLIAIIGSNIDWSIAKAMTLAFMIIGGVGIFTGLFIIFASFSFYTVQGIELANIFTDGGREMSQYPLSIYAKPVLKFFTYIVPFALVNYLPLNHLLDVPGYESYFYGLLPLLGVGFLVPSLLIFNLSTKKYMSTGS